MAEQWGVVARNRDLVLDMMREGIRLQDIAMCLGLKSYTAISHSLRDDPDYRAAHEQALERRMDLRESELERANDSVSVHRAERLLSQARWRAEREAPHRWGQHKMLHVSSHSAAPVDMAPARDLLQAVRVFDNEPLPAPAPSDTGDAGDTHDTDGGHAE